MKYFEYICKILFCISLPFLCLVLSERADTSIIDITFFITLFIAIFIIFKVFPNIYKKINNKIFILCIFISIYLGEIFIDFSKNSFNYFEKILIDRNIYIKEEKLFLLLLILPSLISLIYLLINFISKHIQNIKKSITKQEKIILIAAVIISFLGLSYLYNKTNIFYYPTLNEYPIYDVIYTSDSSFLYNEEVYLNINMYENDLKQPLFGLFSLPFGFISKVLSKIFYFLPNGYAIFLGISQILAILVSLILITRMLKLNKKMQLLFIILSMSTYSYLLFSLTLEQYAFAFFYLILAIYMFYEKKEKINYYYIGAVGTLLTSGIIFPLISKFNNIKEWIKNVFKCFIAFVFTTIISGQLYQFINYKERFKFIMGFSGEEITFTNKFNQFTNFVKSIFIAPNSHIQNSWYYSYQLDIVDKISILGLTILIICIISFIINRKEKIAKLSILWILFSFIILCVVGWGTKENGLILYSLYFSWAYIILIYMLLKKIIKNEKIFMIFIAVLITILLFINIIQLNDLINFGIKYYGI